MNFGKTSQPTQISRGDVIPASWLNKIAEFIVQRITVANGRVRRIGTSLVIEVDPARGGSTPAAEHRYFEITAAEGSSPPFLYSGDEVEWNSTSHAFAAKTGGVTITGDLRSIAEAAYPYAAKIPIGAFVEAWQEGSDWLCQVVHYKGVYPG